MRPNRLAFPLAILLSLLLAAPAGAAFDWNTQVLNYEFNPKEHKISVGDTVTWDFVDEGHTSASVGGQPDSWKSSDTEPNAAGTSYSHTFNTAGKYQYVCLQHRDFMTGTIEVGADAVIDSVSKFTLKRTGHTVKIGFLLNEPAKITYKLSGPSRRTVRRGRLDAGRHSFRLRRLKKGTYRGKLTVVDDFDKKITPRNFFVIR